MRDLLASLGAFWVALPLVVGVSQALGLPIESSLIACLVGAFCVSWLASSAQVVCATSASLVACSLWVLQTVGSGPAFALVVCLAGLIQCGIAFLRVSSVSAVVPNRVIAGMMSGMGVTLLLKQIPHALGRDVDFEGDLGFLERFGGENTLTDILHSIAGAQPGAVLVFVVTSSVLWLWHRGILRGKSFVGRRILGVWLALVAGTLTYHFVPYGEGEHVLSLAWTGSVWAGLHAWRTLDWGVLFRTEVWGAALILGILSGSETLLTAEAMDRLSPQLQVSDKRRDLFAGGIGNVFSGLLGGLPVSFSLIRSAANLEFGAKSPFSALLSGVWVGLAFVVGGSLLQKIPLSAFAAVLMGAGWLLVRRASPIQLWKEGWESFLPYAVTGIGILFTTPLQGIAAGLCVGLFFMIRSNYHSAVTIVQDGQDVLVRLNQDVTFLNKMKLKEALAKIKPGSSVWIDGARALFVDQDILEVIRDFQKSSEFRSIRVEIRDLDQKRHQPQKWKGIYVR